MVNSSYVKNLTSKVIAHSDSNTWDEAVKEWSVVGFDIDPNSHGACVCGQNNLYYLYTIRNHENGNELSPIGSSCIRKFNRADLNTRVTTLEKQLDLLHALEHNTFIKLDSNYFSKKLLKYLFYNGAFEDDNYDSMNNYQFMVDMFNQRKQPTESQQKKINAIIIKNIIPYLRQLEKSRIF